MTWKRTWFLLLATLLLGAALRCVDLGKNSFVADEFLDINSAYGYRMMGEWKAWDFNFGVPATMNENVARDERAFVYKWQVAALFEVLPPTEAVARLVSVFWGLLSIVVIFWSTWIFTRRQEVSLVAALLLALSVSAIIQSRRLRMYAMFFPVYLAAATAWYGFYEEEYKGKLGIAKKLYERYHVHLGYLVLALPFTVLALLTHQLAGHVVIALALYIIVRAWQTRALDWKTNRYLLSVALGALLALVVIIATPKVLAGFTKELIFFDDHFGYITHAFRDFATVALGIVLTGFGLWHLARVDKQSVAALYLGTAFLSPLLMAIFLWNRNVGAQYIFFIQSFIMMVAAIGLGGLYQLMVEKWQLKSSKQFVLVGLLLLMLVPNWGYFTEENNTYHETSTGGNPQYRKIFTYFKKEKRDGDALITRNFRNYYWSGAKVPVYDFGGELSKTKLSLAEVKVAETKTTGRVWFIASGNDMDYVANEVETYLRENYEQMSNDQVRGDVLVYRSKQ